MFLSLVLIIVPILVMAVSIRGVVSSYAGSIGEGVSLLGLMCSIAFIVGSTFNLVISHTLGETENLNKHAELTLQYAVCEERQNINCAAIVLEVLKFNKDLRDHKHYNQIFDLYNSDQVASLPYIGR